MAGIGFTLRELTRRESIAAPAAGYIYSALVTSGPWLFTVAAIAIINITAEGHIDPEQVMLFRSIIIYDFAFSLAFTGPVASVTTRFLSDLIYANDVRAAPTALIGGLAIAFLTQAPFALWLYLSYADLPDILRVLALASYFLTVGLWVAAVFLSALKDYATISFAFLAGMGGGAAIAIALDPNEASGLLAGFTIGLAIAFFILVAKVFAEYPYPLTGARAYLAYYREYRDLAISGFVYNAAIWVDKWVMWFAPERIVPDSGLISFPIYDGAMFYAQLLLIPAMAVFVVNVETVFFERYRRFYSGIQRHATLADIDAAHGAIRRNIAASARNLTVLAFTVSVLAVLSSASFADAVAMEAQQLGIFRFGAFGAAFHAIFLFATIGLAYFDLRREVLWLQVLFLTLNGALTAATIPFGFAYYGYGYFMAVLISALVAAVVLWRAVQRLPWLTFIGNNPAILKR